MTSNALLPEGSLSGSVKFVSECRHIFVELEHFVLEGYIFDRSILFVTFEPAGVAQVNKSKFRPGWGENLFRNLRKSCLCIKANKSNWYLEADLPQALAELRGFFDSFERVVTYGGSMGGFGCLTYADLIGADTVVSINPQSTLDRAIVPWEDRYPVAQEQLLDFSHPYADAVGKYKTVRQVLIFSDRWYDYDDKHAQRLLASNVTYVNTPFVEHQLPEHLVHMKALVMIVKAVIADNFSETAFYHQLRNRRDLKRYFNVLERKAAGHTARLETIARYRTQSRLVGAE